MPLGHKAQLEQVHRELLVFKVLQVVQGRKAQLAATDLQVPRALLVQLVVQVHKAQQVVQVLKAQQVVQVLKAPLVLVLSLLSIISKIPELVRWGYRLVLRQKDLLLHIMDIIELIPLLTI
jgi:hypothetical protein